MKARNLIVASLILGGAFLSTGDAQAVPTSQFHGSRITSHMGSELTIHPSTVNHASVRISHPDAYKLDTSHRMAGSCDYPYHGC